MALKVVDQVHGIKSGRSSLCFKLLFYYTVFL